MNYASGGGAWPKESQKKAGEQEKATHRSRAGRHPARMEATNPTGQIMPLAGPSMVLQMPNPTDMEVDVEDTLADHEAPVEKTDADFFNDFDDDFDDEVRALHAGYAPRMLFARAFFHVHHTTHAFARDQLTARMVVYAGPRLMAAASCLTCRPIAFTCASHVSSHFAARELA